MKKNTIKHITLSHLLKVFLISVLIIASVVALSTRAILHFAIEKKILSVSEVIKAGLTSHMKAGIMDKREYFLNEISSVHDIKSIKIIRGDAVTKQFGESSLFEKKLTDDIRKILGKKEVYIKWNEISTNVEAIVPYVANAEGALNCLQCHNVNDGDVLGAVNITIDTTVYQDFVLKNSYMIVGILLLLVLITVLNIFHIIERYIRKPLLSIIDDGEVAYDLNKAIDGDKYESKEFQGVAENINKFNKHVLHKEEELKDKNIQLQLLNEEIESTLKETMLAVGRIEEVRSKEIKNHTQRVAIISTLIAKKYGLNEEQIHLIELAAPLHDIGKIGISDFILNKPGPLTDEEYELMKTHSTLGYEILNHSKRVILQTAGRIAYEHHEKYDGSGYPRGIKGDEISIYARIVAIVDVLDALFSKRVYKDVWPIENVKILLDEQRGKHFDPMLVEIVLENIEEYRAIIQDP